MSACQASQTGASICVSSPISGVYIFLGFENIMMCSRVVEDALSKTFNSEK